MDYVVFGQVITDDIYFPGKKPMKNFLGGAVYTAFRNPDLVGVSRYMQRRRPRL